MIDINNRQDIIKKLGGLEIVSSPMFGKMTAQHMVEHLMVALMFSNSKLPQKLYFAHDKADFDLFRQGISRWI